MINNQYKERSTTPAYNVKLNNYVLLSVSISLVFNKHRKFNALFERGGPLSFSELWFNAHTISRVAVTLIKRMHGAYMKSPGARLRRYVLKRLTVYASYLLDCKSYII